MKIIRKSFAVILVFILSISVFGTADVSAAAKAKLNKKTATIYVGKTVSLKVKNYKGKVKWSSSNKKVATVSSKGKVKGKKAGKVTIKAKAGKKIYKCKVTVKAKEVTNSNSQPEQVTNQTTPETSSQVNNTPAPVVVPVEKTTKEKIADACVTYGKVSNSDTMGTYYYLSNIVNSDEVTVYTEVIYSPTLNRIRIRSLFGTDSDFNYLVYFDIVSVEDTVCDAVFYYDTYELYGYGILYKDLINSTSAVVFSNTNMGTDSCSTAVELTTIVFKLALLQFNQIMSTYNVGVTAADLGFNIIL